MDIVTIAAGIVLAAFILGILSAIGASTGGSYMQSKPHIGAPAMCVHCRSWYYPDDRPNMRKNPDYDGYCSAFCYYERHG